jgi:hypothetical protein
MNQTNPNCYTANLALPMICSKDIKQVRQELLNVCVAPKATFNIDSAALRPIQVVKTAIGDRLQAQALTTPQSSVMYGGIATNQIPDNGVVWNKSYSAVNTNPSSNISSSSSSYLNADSAQIHVKDQLQGSIASNVNSYFEIDRSAPVKMIDLNRNLPQWAVSNSISDSRVDMNPDLCDRNYRNLVPRTRRGSFENSGHRTDFDSSDRHAATIRLNTNSTLKRAAETFANRYQH